MRISLATGPNSSPRAWRRWRSGWSLPVAKEKDTLTRRQLGVGLAAVAGHLEPAEGARMCAEAAQLLKQELTQEKEAVIRRFLAEGLAAVVERLHPVEAARLCTEAA